MNYKRGANQRLATECSLINMVTNLNLRDYQHNPYNPGIGPALVRCGFLLILFFTCSCSCVVVFFFYSKKCTLIEY